MDQKKEQAKKTVIISNLQQTKSAKIGLLINTVSKSETGFSIDGIYIFNHDNQSKVQRFPITNASVKDFSKIPNNLAWAVKLFKNENVISHREHLEWVFINQRFSSIGIEDFLKNGMQEYYFNLFKEIKSVAPLFSWHYHSVDPNHHTTVTRPAAISSYTPKVFFEVVKTKSENLQVEAKVDINGTVYPLSDFTRTSILLRSNNEFFIITPKDAQLLDDFPKGYIDVPKKNQDDFLNKLFAKIGDNNEIKKDILLNREIIETEPQCNVYLSELNNAFLMLKPSWVYGDFEIEDDNELTTEVPLLRVIYEIKRNAEKEKEFRELLRSQHKKFENQNNGFFYLPFADAEKSQWLVKCYRKLSDKNLGILGMDTLKHFRYNMNVPEIKFEFDGKGIDWFDLTVEVRFGDQYVSLSDLRKAILHKQPHLILGDGSIGAIPEEWFSKYDMLLSLGETNKNKLRLSKFHWDLTGEIENGEAIRKEIISVQSLQKWQKLQNNSKEVFAVPKQIQAQLRDYQKAGFNWMCMLDEMKWSGCLADDMGLGKTLQTITFLQYIVNSYKKETHLVVCPTSLIFNWEVELKKFAPQITYVIFHGSGRKVDFKDWKKKDLIITSYGTVRSDIDMLSKFSFGYIVLDESHVIKNVSSLATKAVVQLKSRNRLTLSGTPIQNNTLELYSQMQFLNPGLLGGQDYFKRTFATPIDKFGNKEASQKLRKLIYPFMLRRTKEQVAKDLPPKTEMVLWCEMGDQQRKVYNEVRDYYRESLLNRIDGGSVGIYTIEVLAGLNKLRLICNSPQLVKDMQATTQESVKLEELLREIEENIGDRKALVFSQFTGMLGLIKDQMDEKNISYLYLDGHTKAETRQELVNEFQTDDSIRIFLISLKAGGVGLTLTAADYVYLVDPWWNPAAEQQAIDRTHRIGQQNNVFAYRMICKDSVEEKILELQERKKYIASELIAEDSGFIKKLTTEDVEYLFS